MIIIARQFNESLALLKLTYHAFLLPYAYDYVSFYVPYGKSDALGSK